ncbi:MAG: 3-dehydroquinate synthase [Advenella sp.]|uniref:3-dehydroquinate synthase n=1 Tax=unclassified Advenella TaxID=2685285 RepID=UPI001868900E|nr:3-dehydroquinate synthase [Advenella sp. FME57]
MAPVNVATSAGQYPIHIAPGRLQHIAESVPVNATRLVVISNPVVDGLYGEALRQALAGLHKPVLTIIVPDGESFKSLDTLNTIYDRMLTEKLDRRAVVLALGGGVIGDMAGFAAATYMRGIRYMQIPTTLLAQVDSSVGGKTAVNHPLGKNMIGAFYQPVSVDIDIDVLRTLPAREVSAGLAEVIKYGLILDRAFFEWCESNVAQLVALDADALAYAIARCCELKAQVVSEDEKETGLRAILNLGHTFGHAIEAGLGFGTWLHGEAVACGLVQAAVLSGKVLGLPAADIARVRALVRAIGCPDIAPDLGGSTWLDLMQGDKKTEGGEIRYVLMPAIGQAVVQAAPLKQVQETLSDTVGDIAIDRGAVQVPDMAGARA